MRDKTLCSSYSDKDEHTAQYGENNKKNHFTNGARNALSKTTAITPIVQMNTGCLCFGIILPPLKYSVMPAFPTVNQ
jgi:hypothetical protein